MSMRKPTDFQLYDQYLAITWEDGHESLLAYVPLRQACPCANCRGEPDLRGGIIPPAQPPDIGEQGHNLAEVMPIGHYGLQLIWGDGHATGIYSFEYLRSLCDCDRCLAERESIA
ncbi:gamma-butyrobetaine hydroxylase-like domain-containing protein [Candidatus Neomarinimicrobiota bacterium]